MPTATGILGAGSYHALEGAFCELLRLDGVLGSTHRASDDSIVLVMERGGPWGFLQADREGEGNAQDAQSKAGGAAQVRGASGVRAGGHRASMDGSWRFSGGCERCGSIGDRRPGDPGASREARPDPALEYRGARGRTTARKGASRRAGAKDGRRAGANLSSTGK